MSKTIKISVTCPKCTTKLAVPISRNDLGTKKSMTCPKCHHNLIVNIPKSLASRFESDPTMIDSIPTQIGNNTNEMCLLLEIISNQDTDYQSFELTSDYYTIGRKNSSGPEYRPDVEVITTDKKISRKHVIIRKRGNIGYTLKDLGSKNGVFLNGDKLDAEEEMYLHDGDVFKLGDTGFRVSITEKSNDYDDLTR